MGDQRTQPASNLPSSSGELAERAQFQRHPSINVATLLPLVNHGPIGSAAQIASTAPRVSTDDVVAAQTYWFWVLLLTARYDQRIWAREFGRSFPFAPSRIDRELMRGRADTVRRLRNRIAHWEPLLDVDLVGAYQRAASVVRWTSPATAEWMAERWPLPPEVLARP